MARSQRGETIGRGGGMGAGGGGYESEGKPGFVILTFVLRPNSFTLINHSSSHV